MNKVQLIDAVYDITNRPDLDALTKQSVEKAILKCHLLDFFEIDLTEVTPAAQAVATQYMSWNLTQAPFNVFREVGYVRHYDAGDVYQTGTMFASYTAGPPLPGKYLVRRKADKQFDEYQLQLLDAFWIVGQTLNLALAYPATQVIIGYYSLPIYDDTSNFNSVIAAMYPYGIIHLAASAVFKAIGYDSPADTYARMFDDPLNPSDGSLDKNIILSMFGAGIGH
jgi:hypothetical protein